MAAQSIPDLMKDMRGRRKLSQRQAAELAEVSQENWCRWEGGVHRPPEGELARIADALDYPHEVAVLERKKK